MSTRDSKPPVSIFTAKQYYSAGAKKHNHRCQFRGIPRHFKVRTDAAPTGLFLLRAVFLQRYRSYGTQEVFEAFKVFCKIRFGWETEPTGPGAEAVIVLKLTLMLEQRNTTYPCANAIRVEIKPQHSGVSSRQRRGMSIEMTVDDLLHSSGVLCPESALDIRTFFSALGSETKLIGK